MKNLHRVVAATCLTAGVAAWTVSGCAQQAGNAQVKGALDPDQNGLYDDRERKALVEVLQKHAPQVEDTFDADGDGKVTIEEQSKGRHPISMPVPRTIVKQQIPWAIDIFPEWISTAYLQEDVAPGTVAELVPRGLFQRKAAPVDAKRQPKKVASGGGIEFAANSGQQLTMPGHRNARWDYRWLVFTFRIDAGTGTDAETLLLDVNRGKDSGRSSPKVWYHMDNGLHVQYVGTNQGGLDKRVMVADNVVADGKTWNVLVCGIRYGQMFASVNGVELKTESPQKSRFVSAEIHESPPSVSFIGDLGQGHMQWAYDAIIFGLTEPTEAMVRKMTGWAAHRLDFEQNLPKDHPYRNARPVLDEEDLPARYVHDEEKWTQWGAKASDKSITRANAGGARVEPKGFERVFYDDFRNDRSDFSGSGEGDLWVGPGFNTAVGVDAPLAVPGRKPNAYPYDAEKQQQTLSLAPAGNDRWRGSALYTVNDMGHGYTWKGPKIFRIRAKFPRTDQKDLAGGLFPAFWSYDPDFLFWRTANRIEVDYFEFDGQNGKWLNGLSTHYHYSHLKDNIFAKNPKGYKRYKVYGGELTEEKSKIPGGLFFWDGQFHTWEFVIDEDMTYINVTIPDGNGGEKWVEVARTPTSPTYLQRLNLQINYALKARYGKPTKQEDFIVDFVEVLQKSEDLDDVPAPFTARPQITGKNTAGSTITCDPNLKGITDVRYYWFADGYPLTWGPINTYKVTEAEAGKVIRCMVKAVGALDSPEAWSNSLR